MGNEGYVRRVCLDGTSGMRVIFTCRIHALVGCLLFSRAFM